MKFVCSRRYRWKVAQFTNIDLRILHLKAGPGSIVGMQLIDQTSATKLVRALIPDWLWLLQHIESEDGYVRFPPVVSRWIADLNIENYPELYEDEARIGAMTLRAFLSTEEINVLAAQLTVLSPEERGVFLQERIQDIKIAVDAFEIPSTPVEQKRAEEAFRVLSEQEKEESVASWQYMVMGLLASFYQSLSVMVHGEKLTSLVAQAMAGNDRAFAKAVQIDKRILFGIPYFKKRFADANTEGDHRFTEEVGAHLSRPPYKGKIRHKALYLAFAFLEQVGLLDKMRHREILDLCNEAGLDAHANRIDDVKNLSKRLTEFRAFQRRGLDLSTP